MFIEVSADGFYVIRDFSGISAWVCEFYSTFLLSFWSHFQKKGLVVYVVLASLSRVRFGECLLCEFLQSEHLVGWLGGSGSLGYFEVKGRVLTVMRLTSRLSLFRKNRALSTRSLWLLASNNIYTFLYSLYLHLVNRNYWTKPKKSTSNFHLN